MTIVLINVLVLMITPENILMLWIVFTMLREIINLLGNFNLSLIENYIISHRIHHKLHWNLKRSVDSFYN